MQNKRHHHKQRVVTIMAADIVNASGLIGDSRETLEQLAVRRNTFVKFVEIFGGRVFSVTGEKFLAEFSSAIVSLRCALNLQEAIKKINSSLRDEDQLFLRIGLNIGDVTQQGQNLIGHGVNIASHLETIAEAGGICIARNVYEQVQPEFDLEYQFQGDEKIKGSGIPVSTFFLSGKETKTPNSFAKFVKTFKKQALFRYQVILIAILALFLANIIGRLIDAPFLSSALQVFILTVAALFSFFHYKKLLTPNSNRPRKEFLDRDLIENVLQAVEEQPIINTNPLRPSDIGSSVPTLAVLRFIDASSEQDQSYFSDGLSEELINILSKVDKLKVSSRKTSFTYDPKLTSAKEFADDLDIDYYIVGTVDKYDNRLVIHVEIFDARTDDSLWSDGYDSVLSDIFTVQEHITQHIAEVLSLDLLPNPDKNSLTSNARAYDFYLRGRDYFIHKGIDNIQHAIHMYTMAGRLDPKFIRAWTDLAETYAIQAIFYHGGTEAVNNSKRIANKVLLMAPERAETYVALGMAHLSNEERTLAAGRFEKAISINPNSFEAQHNFARTHYHQGNSAEAIRHFEKSAAIEPLDFESYALAAPLYMALGEEEQAIETYKKALARIKKFIASSPDNQRAYQLGAIALLKLGETEKATQWAEQALELGKNDPATLYNIACFYSLVGEIDKSIECLSESITSRSWIENDPELDAIRKHPRYQEIIEKLSH